MAINVKDSLGRTWQTSEDKLPFECYNGEWLMRGNESLGVREN